MDYNPVIVLKSGHKRFKNTLSVKLSLQISGLKMFSCVVQEFNWPILTVFEIMPEFALDLKKNSKRSTAI